VQLVVNIGAGRLSMASATVSAFEAAAPEPDWTVGVASSAFVSDFPCEPPSTRGAERETLQLVGASGPPFEPTFRPLDADTARRAFGSSALSDEVVRANTGGDGPCEPSPSSRWIALARDPHLRRLANDSSLVVPTEQPSLVLQKYGVDESTAFSGKAPAILRILHQNGNLQRAFEHVLDLTLMRLDPEGQEAKTLLSSKRVQRSTASLGFNLSELALRSDEVMTEEYKDLLKKAVKVVSSRLPSSALKDAKRLKKSRQSGKAGVNEATGHVKPEP